MKIINWCMCLKLKAVARDMYSTCSICGGRDAYGTSEARPKDKQKVIAELETNQQESEE